MSYLTMEQDRVTRRLSSVSVYRVRASVGPSPFYRSPTFHSLYIFVLVNRKRKPASLAAPPATRPPDAKYVGRSHIPGVSETRDVITAARVDVDAAFECR